MNYEQHITKKDFLKKDVLNQLELIKNKLDGLDFDVLQRLEKTIFLTLFKLDIIKIEI